MFATEMYEVSFAVRILSYSGEVLRGSFEVFTCSAEVKFPGQISSKHSPESDDGGSVVTKDFNIYLKRVVAFPFPSPVELCVGVDNGAKFSSVILEFMTMVEFMASSVTSGSTVTSDEDSVPSPSPPSFSFINEAKEFSVTSLLLLPSSHSASSIYAAVPVNENECDYSEDFSGCVS